MGCGDGDGSEFVDGGPRSFAVCLRKDTAVDAGGTTTTEIKLGIVPTLLE